MSLADAMLKLADKMEDHLREVRGGEIELTPTVVSMLVSSYADQIRIAVKASEQVAQPLLTQGSILAAVRSQMESGNPPPLTQAFVASSQEKAAREQQLAKAEEREGALSRHMAECVGGESDGCLVPTDPKMPVGAKTVVSGEVYQLGVGGRLHFMEEATRQYREKR